MWISLKSLMYINDCSGYNHKLNKVFTEITGTYKSALWWQILFSNIILYK